MPTKQKRGYYKPPMHTANWLRVSLSEAELIAFAKDNSITRKFVSNDLEPDHYLIDKAELLEFSAADPVRKTYVNGLLRGSHSRPALEAAK